MGDEGDKGTGIVWLEDGRRGRLRAGRRASAVARGVIRLGRGFREPRALRAARARAARARVAVARRASFSPSLAVPVRPVAQIAIWAREAVPQIPNWAGTVPASPTLRAAPARSPGPASRRPPKSRFGRHGSRNHAWRREGPPVRILLAAPRPSRPLAQIANWVAGGPRRRPETGGAAARRPADNVTSPPQRDIPPKSRFGRQLRQGPCGVDPNRDLGRGLYVRARMGGPSRPQDA